MWGVFECSFEVLCPKTLKYSKGPNLLLLKIYIAGVGVVVAVVLSLSKRYQKLFVNMAVAKKE